MTVFQSDVERLRRASELWRTETVATRVRFVRRFRRLLRRNWPVLLKMFPDRPRVETLTAELLPLLAACRFLEKQAAGVLRDRKVGFWGRPLWLPGVTSVVERRPYGAVLVLAPGNYPLMLPGIQVLQAIVAGNAVALKPAPGGEAAAHLLRKLLCRAGFPSALCSVFSTDSGPDAVNSGFDLIVLTGSARTGRTILRQVAETLTPVIMELSGVDPVFVLPGADLGHVARRLVYGARLNNGSTCIAPHRVFISHESKDGLVRRLKALLEKKPSLLVEDCEGRRLDVLRRIVEGAGGTVQSINGVMILTEVEGLHHLLDTDIFAPWLAVVGVADMQEALGLDGQISYALGASIFGEERLARSLARKLSCGSVCINDLIVPTADARLPFSGARGSGYGVTRGVEGLLALTRPVGISVRRRMFF